MAENKVISKQYLRRQLQLLAGRQLYGQTKTRTIVSTATAARYTGPYGSAAGSYFKYTGTYEATAITTAAEATNYTTLCGETIAIGDKVRPSILVTEDNIDQFATDIPGVDVGDYVKPTTDCRIAGGSADLSLEYLNSNFFQADNVASGDYIIYTPDEITVVTNELGSFIKDLYDNKLTIVYCTTSQYYAWRTGSLTEKNTIYYVTNATQPTAWLNGQNILGGGGGIDTSTAQDGNFLVYNAAEAKPVWKQIWNGDLIDW